MCKNDHFVNPKKTLEYSRYQRYQKSDKKEAAAVLLLLLFLQLVRRRAVCQTPKRESAGFVLLALSSSDLLFSCLQTHTLIFVFVSSDRRTNVFLVPAEKRRRRIIRGGAKRRTQNGHKLKSDFCSSLLAPLIPYPFLKGYHNLMPKYAEEFALCLLKACSAQLVFLSLRSVFLSQR